MATHGETRRAVGHGLSKHQGRPPVALDFYIETPFSPQDLTGIMFSEGDFPSAGSGVIVFYPGTGRIRMRNAGEFMRKRGRSAYAGGEARRTAQDSESAKPVEPRARAPRLAAAERDAPKARPKTREAAEPPLAPAGAGTKESRRASRGVPSPRRPPFRARSGATSAPAAPTPAARRKLPPPVSASLAYAAFRRISGISWSIFVIKMPYPVVGSLMSTWVTAPTNLPS